MTTEAHGFLGTLVNVKARIGSRPSEWKDTYEMKYCGHLKALQGALDLEPEHKASGEARCDES